MIAQYFQFSTAALVILIVFGTVTLLQLFYYLYFYSRVAFGKRVKGYASPHPVSVVICARNEAANLQKYLPMVLEQDYPDFEVIVVNDCSTDASEDVLNELSALYPNLRYTYIKPDDKFEHGKKLALTVGIKAAKHEWLLLTDADCYPTSSKWIASMASHFTSKKSVVLGYSGFVRDKSFLNRLIRYDTMTIALQYLSFARAGVPYMGVGRNLAYRRSLFFKNKGFASHLGIRSGDDDLFVNEVANHQNTWVEYLPESHTRTAAKKTFRDWRYQKMRHLTTGSLYKTHHLSLLGLENISRVLFYLLFVAALFWKSLWIPAIIMLILRMSLFYVVMVRVTKKLNEPRLRLWAWYFDLIMPFLNLFFYLVNSFTSNKKWK